MPARPRVAASCWHQKYAERCPALYSAGAESARPPTASASTGLLRKKGGGKEMIGNPSVVQPPVSAATSMGSCGVIGWVSLAKGWTGFQFAGSSQEATRAGLSAIHLSTAASGLAPPSMASITLPISSEFQDSFFSRATTAGALPCSPGWITLEVCSSPP